MREITHNYEDPLNLIWIHAATEMGMRIVRDDEVFAAWDGAGTLTIGTQETLDPDDSLAQMILHETCHALVEGSEAFDKPDWGLDITDRSQLVHEHACLRLQAALSQPYGLREFFASTTNARSYYDQLPNDPMTPPTDEAVQLAVPGLGRALEGPWSKTLRNALTNTSRLATIVRDISPVASIWSRTQSCHEDSVP